MLLREHAVVFFSANAINTTQLTITRRQALFARAGHISATIGSVLALTTATTASTLTRESPLKREGIQRQVSLALSTHLAFA
jgi:hypothetical protein